VIEHDREHREQVAEMLGPRGAEYQYVVEVLQAELTKERSEHIIHEGLEHGWGVGEVERRDKELVEVIMGAERCIRTWWYPERRSNLVKNLVPCNSSRSSSTTRIGNLSLTVRSLRALCHIGAIVPSDIGARCHQISSLGGQVQKRLKSCA
jgi:hypothetical protein